MRVANTERPSGVWAMPFLARMYAGSPVTSEPLRSSRPAVGAMSPEQTRATVVLPAPLGPTRATAVPAPIENDTPNSARNGP